MPHNLSLVAEDPLTSISVPDNGDDLDAAAVETIVQLLGNKSVLHRTAFLGHIAWTERLSVAPGGSLTSFSINVGGILRVVGDDSNGVRRATGAAATTITQTKIEGGGGTLGASARWWYVYAFLTTAGDVDYAISLTGPGAFGRTKDGDTTRVYLGCFPTDTTGAPFPVTRVGNRTLYRRSGVASVESPLGSNGLRAVDGATAVGRTVLDLTSRVPPHSRVALLYGQVLAVASGSSGVGALNLYTAADTTSIALVIETQAEGSGAKGVNGSHAEVELTSAQLCAYSVTQSSAAAVGDLDVLGWLE